MLRFLNKTAALMIAVLLTVLLILPYGSDALRASASDTKLYLNSSSLELDQKFYPTAKIAGFIAGDTSSQYYVYALDTAGIISISDGYNMTGTKFSLDITAVKAGTSRVMVAVKDLKTGVNCAEEYLTVTVTDYDLGKLQMTCSMEQTTVYSGSTDLAYLNVTNCPAELYIVFSSAYSSRSNIIKTEWDEITKDGTNRSAVLKIIGLVPGTDTITVSLKEKATGEAIASCTIKVRVLPNVWQNYSNYTFDLADSDVFTLNTYTLPTELPSEIRTSSSVQLKNCTQEKSHASDDRAVRCAYQFQPKETGVFDIQIAQYLEFKDTWYQGTAAKFSVRVIDSRVTPELDSLADNIRFDSSLYSIGRDQIGRQITIPVFLKQDFMYPDAETAFQVKVKGDCVTLVDQEITDQYSSNPAAVPGNAESAPVASDSEEVYAVGAVYIKAVKEGRAVLTVSKTDPLSNSVVESHDIVISIGETVRVKGDINADGRFDTADIVLMQKWLLALPNSQCADWKAGDFYVDDCLTVADLGLMKNALLNGR